MLDNEEFVLESRPRELTQNPLKKIWMPYKNGHIAQRRGKSTAGPACAPEDESEQMLDIYTHTSSQFLK